jgi:hypothetical protein
LLGLESSEQLPSIACGIGKSEQNLFKFLTGFVATFSSSSTCALTLLPKIFFDFADISVASGNISGGLLA